MGYEELWAIIVGLGDTPDRIAKTLREKGIKGVRHERCDCPIARYVRHVAGGGLYSVSVHNSSVHHEHNRWSLPLPPAVDRFVRAFDGGKYPELEELEELAG